MEAAGFVGPRPLEWWLGGPWPWFAVAMFLSLISGEALGGGPEPLTPGVLVVLDRQGLGPARILAVDPTTGLVTTLYSSIDGILRSPRDVEVDPNGSLIVSQSWSATKPAPEGVYRFDPGSGTVSVLAEGGIFVDVEGIALGGDGSIFVADRGDPFGRPPAVVRIDPDGGRQEIVTSSGSLASPHDLAVEAGGAILVLDGGSGSGATIVRVDPLSGAQSVLVPPGPIGGGPGGIALEPDDDLLVASAFGSLFRIDRQSGTPAAIAGGPNFLVADVALDTSGDLFLLTTGGSDSLLRVDLVSGTSSLVAAAFVSPKAVAIVRGNGPWCDVETSQAAFVDGETVGLRTLRYAYSGPGPLSSRLRLTITLPDLFPTVLDLLDLVLTLPEGLDKELGPVSMFTVSPGQPRGFYSLRCALEEPSGGVQFQDVAVFELR